MANKSGQNLSLILSWFGRYSRDALPWWYFCMVLMGWSPLVILLSNVAWWYIFLLYWFWYVLLGWSPLMILCWFWYVSPGWSPLMTVYFGVYCWCDFLLRNFIDLVNWLTILYFPKINTIHNHMHSFVDSTKDLYSTYYINPWFNLCLHNKS